MTLRRLAALVLIVVACHGCASAPSRSDAGPIRLVANEFAFLGEPDTVQAGWHLVTVVNAGKQPHMAVIARLDSGKTFHDFLVGSKANTPMPWLREVGGVNAVMPGDSMTSAINLPAGNYLTLCYATDSAGRPHVLNGMAAAFTAAGSGPAAIPEPVGDDTVGLTSYAIAFQSPPTRGMHLFRVEDHDSAAVNHDLVIVRLNDGKTAQDAMNWLDSMQGTPPFSVAGATTGIEPAEHDYIHVDLTPGNYLALCLMPDKADHKPHFVHGMTATFVVGS